MAFLIFNQRSNKLLALIFSLSFQDTRRFFRCVFFLVQAASCLGQEQENNRGMAAKDDSDRMRSLREIVRSKFTVDVLKNAGGELCLAFLLNFSYFL
jgi:membrane-anchored glycerophosphoryl diester phosphodiesterase (GDPDase)